MIHHISIPAENPYHVAQVLAEICQGQAIPFYPHPGSYMVLALDEFGTAIEVYPLGTELIPGVGDQQAHFIQNALPSQFTATHAAFSVPASEDKIIQIAAREGWRCLVCNRDSFFNVIEFWVENSLMIELLPPAFTAQYLEFTQPQKMQKFLQKAVAV